MDSQSRHIIFFLYALILFVSSSGFASLFLLFRRAGGRILKELLQLNGIFLLFLIFQFVLTYLRSTGLMTGLPSAGIHVIIFLWGILIFVLLYKISITVSPVQKGLILTVTLLRIAVQGLGLLPLIQTSGIVMLPVRMAFIVAGSLYLFLIGFAFARKNEVLTETEKEGLEIIGLLGRSLMIFAPLSMIYYLVSLIFQLSGLWNILLDYALLLLLSLISIRTLLGRPEKSILKEEEINNRLLEEYGISPREKDVLLLIARGLSNQEIADRLFISLTTAKTHIYHLFQKTGSKNRIDLLQRISGG